MSSYYSIVQYSPNPINGERINFGVIVFGDGTVRSQFVKNWHRVRQFAGPDTGALRRFVADAPKFTEVDVRRMISEWTYSIRLTEPRGSLLSSADLLPDMVSEFLIDPPEHKAMYRYRSDAADLAKRSLSKAMKAQVHADAKKYVKSDLRIEGRKGTHYLDVGLLNKRPRVGVRGLSFEIPDGRDLLKEINSTTFTIQDILKQLPGMKMSIVVLPPKRKNERFKRAIGGFEDEGAQVVEEGDVESWARKAAASFIAEHASNVPHRTLTSHNR